MAKRIIVPAGALEDIRALIRLSAEQLEALVRLFALPESVSAQRKKFVDTVAETLRVSQHDAQSVVMVCHFVLLAMEETRGRDANVVRDIIDDIREFLAERAPDEERQELIGLLDANRELFEKLAIPSNDRLRAWKVRQLSKGVDRTVESVRTLCQLIPLFEGEELREGIVGLVQTVVLEIEASNEDGDTRTFRFGLNSEALSELERVVSRTKKKLELIQTRYHSELLSEL